jgi:hypothetical protein
VVRSGTLPPVARQSIPRFDLYAELGLDPSADMVAIEAAYRELVDGEPEATGAAGVRRTARMRIARDWLTDPDLRERYDASRARSAARAAGKVASKPSGDIPWPAADLARAEAEAAAEADQARARAEVEAETEAREAEAAAQAGAVGGAVGGAVAAAARHDSETRIHWSATPTAPSQDELGDDPRRAAPPVVMPRRRGPMAAIGRVAMVVALGVAAYLITSNLGLLNFAAATPTASPPRASTPEPTLAPPSNVATLPPPTTTPSTAPTEPGTTDLPVAELQQGAYDTIQALIAAAAAGDVETAQRYLGDTAPMLRASGLRQAEWPQLAGPADLGIQQYGDLYIAIHDIDRLTSSDAATWTFDYGDRPLAAYRTEGKNVHDLWWVESDGEHHIFLRLTMATLSPRTFRATLSWTFDPARPNDATYFRRAAIDVTSLSFDDGEPVLTAGRPVAIVGSTTITTSAMLATPLAGDLPSQVTVQITVTNPRSEGGAGRANPTTFTLPIR